jgi:hypothetical protein
MNLWAKTISRLLIALMIWMPYQIATAAMIGTDQAVASTSPQGDRSTVINFLNRSDVANRLQSMGVDASSVKDRVGAMTDQEVQSLASRINSMPAGGDVAWGAILLLIIIAAAVWWFWQR